MVEADNNNVKLPEGAILLQADLTGDESQDSQSNENDTAFWSRVIMNEKAQD